MRQTIRRTTNLGNGYKLVTNETVGEHVRFGIISTIFKAIFIWPFKLVYYMTFGWIVALIKRARR